MFLSNELISRVVKILLLSNLLLFFTACVSNPEPPVAKAVPQTIVRHNIELTDNYSWLKDKSRSRKDVVDYIEAENSFTEKMMKHTSRFRKKLFKEMVGRIQEEDMSVPVKIDSFYYYSRKEKDKQYSIYCRKKFDLNAAEEIYLNVNKLAENYNYYAVSEFKISPDHRYLAFSADTTGSEKYTIYIKDLISGSNLSETFFPADDVTWASDSRTFFYTTENEAGRSFRVYRHTLGNDPQKDELIFQEKDDAFYVWTVKTTSKEYIMICSSSKTARENRFLKADSLFAEFQIIQERMPGLKYYVEHRADKFFIRTNADDSYNYKIMTTSIDKPGKKYWQDYIPHRDSVYIYFNLFKDHLVITERENGIEKLRIRNLESGQDHYLDFPEPIYSVYTYGVPNYETDTLRFSYESMVEPYSVYDYNMITMERKILKQKEIEGGYDPEQYFSERIWAKASDGTAVPISLVYRKDSFQQNATNILYLSAYGSYGDASDPYFSTSRLSLLDRGLIYAVAHVRGGGELGKKWHEQGRMLQKKNTFTDFISCAEFLITEKYTEPEKLVIYGGSAGGLLMGAVANMRPDLFKIVIADVPFVDVLNTMFDPTLSAVVSEYEEWGNPNIKEQFDYIRSYCPYQNVTTQNYPNMLILAGFHDPRVNFWEPAKWTAKLRASKTDNNLLLMRTDMKAGHGGASGRFDYYKEVAFEYAFIFDIFGIKR